MTRCDAAGAGDDPPVAKFGDWFDPDADAAWRAANLEALDLGHRWLGTEHLLLGLLHGPDGDPARSLLSAHDVTVDRARDALVAHIGPPSGPDEAALLATLGIDLDAVRASIEETFGTDAIDRLYARRRRDGHRLDRGPLCGMMLAPRLKRALEQARRAANTEHRPRANTLDLLAGLLAVDDAMAVRLLRTLGVDPVSLQTQLRPRAAG